MKWTAIVLLTASVAFGQTQSKPAAPAAKPGGATTPSVTAGKPPIALTPAAKKPASDLPVLHGVVQPLFTEKYEDYKIGTGALAEPLKLYHVHYTGYLASTGQKFDSSYEHLTPVTGADGKPVMGPDGKPQMGAAQAMIFPQGMGRLIPGFDQGLNGMRIGGKRRIFIPWQLAYGTRDIPSREGHIGIPPKSDLIFDVELLDVTEMPAPVQPQQGAATPRPGTPPTPSGTATPGQPAAAAPATPPAGTAPSAPPASSAPATPSAPPPQSTPQPK